MRNLHLDLVRVTEAGAIAAGCFVGRGDKLGADKAATDAIRNRLNRVDFAGKVVIGEGRKDDAPGLFCGEIVGQLGLSYQQAKTIEETGVQTMIPEVSFYDIAVDPIDGTRPTAKGGYEAMS